MTTLQGCRAIDLIDLATTRQTTDEGTLIAPAQIARTGIQLYRARELGISDGDPDRVLRVLRPHDEVFHPDAMKSFELKPLANDHPPADITAENWRRYAAEGRVIGDVASIDRAGDYVTAQLHVRDKNAVDAINSGKTQLSCGYTFNADMTPGTWLGQQYDLVQRHIRGNHVAVVDRARGGAGCRVSDRDLEPVGTLSARDIFLHRERHLGQAPEELVATSAQDAADTESTMTARDIMNFRDMHGGMSPSEWPSRGNAR